MELLGRDQASDHIRIHPDVHDIRPIVEHLGRPRETLVHRFVMRTLDVVLSLLVLVLAAPAIGLISAIIALDSPGPAVFRQPRVGRDGRLFQFCKFRTMYVDARERFPDLYAYDHSEDELPTLFFKFAEDPRLHALRASPAPDEPRRAAQLHQRPQGRDDPRGTAT